MSVRKSERGLSNIEFLKVLMDIEKWCLLKIVGLEEKIQALEEKVGE